MRLGDVFKKSSDWSTVFLRLSVGIVFLMHGIGKLFNAGPFALGVGNVSGFLGSLGVPAAAFFAWVVAIVEVVGGAFIILGLFTRYAALAVGIDILVALLLVHLPGGLYETNGEIALVMLLGAIALLFSGGGKKLVLERMWFKKEV